MSEPNTPDTHRTWFIGGTIATIALLILLGYLLFGLTSIPLR
ncbi:MAG: hypothetical protein ACR2OU_00710 [Thermomicrobiales bacterium]